MVGEHTVDLEERVEEIRNDRIPAIEERQEEVVAQARKVKEKDEDIPSDLEEDFDELEAERVELEGEANSLEEAMEEWGGSEFVVRELTFGDIQRISDDVMEQSFDVDVRRESVKGTPKQGYYQIATLRDAIEQSPTDAPNDPADYPMAVGEFLFERVNALNTVGDTEMGNSSLKERLKDSEN